jgi:hypothetical protein
MLSTSAIHVLEAPAEYDYGVSVVLVLSGAVHVLEWGF